MSSISLYSSCNLKTESWAQEHAIVFFFWNILLLSSRSCAWPINYGITKIFSKSSAKINIKTEMQKTKWNEEKHGRKEGNEAFDGKIPAN